MLEKYEHALEQWIDTVVSHGDDDALFACGYLQGHVAVVLAELEAEGRSSVAALEEKIVNCMTLAREELNDEDFALVGQAWTQLQQWILV